MKSTESFRETRKELQQSGAEFVLCFFDENSVDRWDVPASNSEAAKEYTFLLEWLLEDPTLGLVIKPKKPTDLYHRLAQISRLIDRARRTGRCTFLTGDSLAGNVYPAQAALAADVAVGRLGADTAALEAQLAGVPALLVDEIALRHYHPFYEKGRGHVVFADWEELRSAVETYRTAPETHPDFGDWSPWLDDLDPFRDGKASQRMGHCINSVYEALEGGASREEALAQVQSEYVREWGNNRVHVV